MKYAQFSEKLMVLDREEEAKRQFDYAQNPQQYQAYNNMGGGPQGPIGEMPDMSDIPGPQPNRRVAAKAAQEDEGGWGDTADLLD